MKMQHAVISIQSHDLILLCAMPNKSIDTRKYVHILFLNNHVEGVHMPKNMTISIPDALFDSLRSVKGEVPISRVCSLALQDEFERIDGYSKEAKVRFACISIEEAERMAFDEGMRWAASDATIEHLVFVAHYDNPDSLEWYEAHCEGLSSLIEEFGEEDYYAGYWLNVQPGNLPEYITARYDYEDDEYHKIAMAFSDGAKAIWKRIEPFAKQEVQGKLKAYIFPEIRRR